MFDIAKEVKRLYQLRHDKVHGLPYKRKPEDPKINHVDNIPYEIQAHQEGIAISESLNVKSLDFGRRLSKAKGERHFPGGFAE